MTDAMESLMDSLDMMLGGLENGSCDVGTLRMGMGLESIEVRFEDGIWRVRREGLCDMRGKTMRHRISSTRLLTFKMRYGGRQTEGEFATCTVPADLVSAVELDGRTVWTA